MHKEVLSRGEIEIKITVRSSGHAYWEICNSQMHSNNSVGEDAETLGPSCIADWNVKYCGWWEIA